MENVLPNMSGLMIETRAVLIVREPVTGADNSDTVLVVRAGQSLFYQPR